MSYCFRMRYSRRVDFKHRIGGRLKNSYVFYMIPSYTVTIHRYLPTYSRFVPQLVSDVHETEKYFHADILLVISIMQDKYWMVDGVKELIPKIIMRHVFYIKLRAKTEDQIIGNFSFERIKKQALRSFTHIRVYLYRTVTVKFTGHRAMKFNKKYVVVMLKVLLDQS